MYSEKEIAELRYQVERFQKSRSIFLGFSILFFVLGAIITPFTFIFGIVFLIVGLTLIGFAILFLIVRSAVFSAKVEEYEAIISMATKQRNKMTEEEKEKMDLEKLEKKLRRIDQSNKKDDFSLDDLK